MRFDTAQRWTRGLVAVREPRAFAHLCAFLAVPRTLARYAELWIRGPRPGRLRDAGLGNGLAAAYRISFARVARRLLKHGVDRSLALRTPRVVLEGRPENLRGSCVVAFLHSPWNQILVGELRARRLCLVLADDVWARSLGPFHAGSGLARVRHALEVLRGGGRVAVVLDDFDDHRFLPARFFDVPVHVRTGVPRLAASADVPVVPLTARFRRGCVRVHVGPRVEVTRDPQDQARAVNELLRFFERQVRQAPDSWGRLLPFLRATGRTEPVCPLPGAVNASRTWLRRRRSRARPRGS